MRMLACVVGLVAVGCVPAPDRVDELYEECLGVAEMSACGGGEAICDRKLNDARERERNIAADPDVYAPGSAEEFMRGGILGARCLSICCPVDGVWSQVCQLTCYRPDEVDRTAERCEDAHQACCAEQLPRPPQSDETACVALGRHGLDAERQACGEMKAACVDHFGLDFEG